MYGRQRLRGIRPLPLNHHRKAMGTDNANLSTQARKVMQQLKQPHTEQPLLQDSFGRQINYLRLAVTDRCNLTCRYCRPSSTASAKASLLSYDELLRLVRIFASLGINKIRLTGGEPFARKGFLGLVRQISTIPGINNLSITTNGTLCFDHIKELKKIGVTGLNFSLDTLSPQRFQQITGADLFHEAFASIMEAVIQGLKVKINVVVLDNLNTDELLHLAGLAENLPIEVRFIEPMPFNGRTNFATSSWTISGLARFFQAKIPGCTEALQTRPSTARLFTARNYQGRIGLIGGHSRSFCHTCNKVRVTPLGMLKTCLYGKEVLDFKKMLCDGYADQALVRAIHAAVQHKAASGIEADNGAQARCSMALIGG